MTRARITSRMPLRYTAGADPSLDRPGHVRAGSGLALVDTPRGRRLLVAQDDAAFLALVTVDAHGRPIDVEALTLPAGPGGARQFDDAPGGRGNKQHKLDLEALVRLADDRGPIVLALGSGSGPARERAVLVRLDQEPPEVRVVEVPALYAALRAHPLLVTNHAELNLEGAALVPDVTPDQAPDQGRGHAVVRLFQRGNGRGGVDATFDLDARALLAHLEGSGPLPPFLAARRWDLGTVATGEGARVRLTFTDACTWRGRICVVAAAEASPNAWDDGEVVGAAFGVLDEDGARLTPLLDERGEPFVGKPEGLALDDAGEQGFIILDPDDPTAPAELCTIVVDSVSG